MRKRNEEVSPEQIAEAKRSMIANPAHLKETLDVVFDRPESNETEYLYRTAFWLAFMGFEMVDVISITTEDIDWDEARIVHVRPNRHLIWSLIPPEAVPDLRRACDLESFTVERKTTVKHYARASGNQIMRGRQILDPADEQGCDRYIRRVLRPMLSNVFLDTKRRFEERLGFVPDWCAIDLTIGRTIKSGVFYRYYERERAGLETNLNNVFQAQYARPEDQGYDYLQFSYQYQKQYMIWKAAFT